MPLANPTPYDYFPRRLHPQGIGNPFNVINLFFGWENFPVKEKILMGELVYQ